MREHAVRGDRPSDAAGDLRRDVGERVAPATGRRSSASTSETTGLKCAAGDRPEHEDDRVEARRGRGGVLEQLEADVAGREASAPRSPSRSRRAARNAEPRNSASRRRVSGGVWHGRLAELIH